MWTVPQMGQMGFHIRTEYNKWVLQVGDDAKMVEKPGGWKHYGVVKSSYMILFGSVPGVPKRLIRMRHAIRLQEKTEAPEVLEIIW
jgi:large subunit ribosomal protein L3